MWKHKNFINVQLHAPGPHDCTVYFDNNIISVTCTGDYGDSDTWTVSGTTMSITSGATDIQYFTVALKDGYVLDSITYTESSQLQLNDVTDNSFNISGDYGQLAMVTLTSKQVPKLNYIISDTELTAIADATRTKADITTKLTPAQIAEKINNLTIVANIDTADKMTALLVAENEGNVYKYVGTTTSDYINGDLYVVEAAPSSGETWLLNETIPTTSQGTGGYNTNFVSNGTTYTYINFDGKPNGIRYSNSTDEILAYSWVDNAWTNTAYRTITFATSPTGDLLTWLQANGTKQGGGGGAVIKASTYLFNEELTGVSGGGNLDLDFVAKGNSLTADNVYGNTVNIEHVLVQGTGFLSLFNTSNGEASWNLVEWVYNDSEEEYVVTDNTKLRTIIVETDQTVSEEFYTWFTANTTKLS